MIPGTPPFKTNPVYHCGDMVLDSKGKVIFEVRADNPAEIAAALVDVLNAHEPMKAALNKLPLEPFEGKDMGELDASDFSDHAKYFMDAMNAARDALKLAGEAQ